MNSVWIDVLDRGVMFAMLALAANLILGLAGQLSLATAAFFGIGSYTAAVLTTDRGWDFMPATAVAVAVSAALGAVLALPVLRVRGEYVVLLTIAFLSVVNQMESSWIDLTGGATGKFPIPALSIFGWSPVTPWEYLPLTVGLLLAVLAVSLLVSESPYGRVLKAIRDDPVATRAVGVPVFRYQVSIFALSAGIAGLVGSAWAAYFAFITPTAFGLDQTIFIAAIVVLGGMGNMWGSVLAALALVALPQVLQSLDVGADHSAEIQQVVYGVALVAFMVFRPQGLLPERVAERHAAPESPANEAVPIVVLDRRADGSRPLLEAQHVSKSFGGVRALEDVSIVLQAGTITALIGPNGAGKTTLFNVLTGDLATDRGTVLRDGRNITGLRPDEIVGLGVARSFQDVRLFASMSAEGNVAVALRDQTGVTLRSLVMHPVRTFRAQRAVLADAGAVLDLVGFDADRRVAVTKLGYGERKLVALARLLATDPDVVLLDEPSSGTDAGWVERVLGIIRDLAASGKAVCIVEHNLDLIRRLEGEAYFLDEGRIIATGSVAELMSERRLLESYLGLS